MDCLSWVFKGRKEKTFKKLNGIISGVASCCIELDYVFLKKIYILVCVCCIKECQFLEENISLFFGNKTWLRDFRVPLLLSFHQCNIFAFDHFDAKRNLHFIRT